MSEYSSNGRTQQGIVVSNKMDKTVVVKIIRRIKHPLYGKIMTRSSKIKAHDPENTCNEGDVVLIKECRPISKDKAYLVAEVLEKSA